MARPKKTTTSIRLNDVIKEKLRQQANAVGMDVSNYIAYLVMYHEEKKKEEEKNKELFSEMVRALGKNKDLLINDEN